MTSFTRFQRSLTLLVAMAVFAFEAPSTDAFTTKSSLSTTGARSFALEPINAKKKVEDLSYIESRDMTREEMLALNKKNEEIMNMELQAMTGFSLILSLPILYLCWVAFFSD